MEIAGKLKIERVDLVGRNRRRMWCTEEMSKGCYFETSGDLMEEMVKVSRHQNC